MKDTSFSNTRQSLSPDNIAKASKYIKDQNKINLLLAYVNSVFEANSSFNITGEKDLNDFWNKQIIDSLDGIPFLNKIASRIIENKKETIIKIADIGSGAGIPAIPLALSLPDYSFTLIEPTQKKADFLSKMTNELSLKNCAVVCDRAEVLAKNNVHAQAYDLIISKAVASLNSLAELAFPLLKIGGYCYFYKNLEPQELEKASHAIAVLGGDEIKIENLICENDRSHNENIFNRSFVIIKKTKETPPLFPRRNGLAQKRPLSN